MVWAVRARYSTCTAAAELTSTRTGELDRTFRNVVCRVAGTTDTQPRQHYTREQSQILLLQCQKTSLPFARLAFYKLCVRIYMLQHAIGLGAAASAVTLKRRRALSLPLACGYGGGLSRRSDSCMYSFLPDTRCSLSMIT